MTSGALGPAPAPSPTRLSPARARVAAVVAELGPSVPLAEVARRLGGHPNAARQHLDALAADGLVEVVSLPRAGRGRPASGYTLTAAGRLALAGDVGRTAYAELVDALAAHLAASGASVEEAREIGRGWGASRATDGGVVPLLAELGFGPDPDADQPGTIRLRTCPILASARRHPGVICAIHHGLIEGALAARASGPGGVSARLVPFAEPGACLVHLGAQPG